MKCINIIWCLLSLLCFTSCEVFNDVDKAYLIENGTTSEEKYLRIIDTDGDDTIVFPNIGGERSITVEYSDFVSWEFSTMPEWIKITPERGGGDKGGQEVVTITVAPNLSEEYRSVTLALSSKEPTWHYTYLFNIGQRGGSLNPTITIKSLRLKKDPSNMYLLTGEAVINPMLCTITEAGFIYSVGGSDTRVKCEIEDNRIAINDLPISYHNWVDVSAYIKSSDGSIFYSGKPIYVGITLPYPR